MNGIHNRWKTVFACLAAALIVTVPLRGAGFGGDLDAVKAAGVLRHLGVPYANFVTGSGDGLDVEMMQLFARHLGVAYAYVPTTWKDVIGDLTGKAVKARGEEIDIVGEVPVRGDVVANGLTILPWRRKIVDYSLPTFPTQIWIVTRADADLKPIVPGAGIDADIAAVRAQLGQKTVLGVANTCLEPSLYHLESAGAVGRLFTGSLNDLAPAVINGEADVTLLDVPDALIALEKWPGQVKVIGPLSRMQNMGVAFAKSSAELRAAFDRFFRRCLEDGTYLALVRKYYPAVFDYYPDFF